MQRLRLIMLVALCGIVGLTPAPLSAQTGAPVQIGVVSFTSVSDWEGGTRDGLLISNNAGGELRLAVDRTTGVFESGLLPTNFRANAVGASWRAETPQGTQLALEVRGGPSGDQLGAWQPLVAGDARSKSDDGAFAVESVRALPPDTNFVQVRVTLTTSAPNASPELTELSLVYINAAAGPAQAAGLTRVPAISGKPTLTPPPQIIERALWAGGAPAPARVTRGTPRGIILHQIGSDTVEAPLPLLRAELAYQTRTLGWEDLPYHYVIDAEGTIFEGLAGGPTTLVSRLSGGDTAIHVALIGSGAPTGATQVALQGLLAWLCQAYDIPPLGQHQVSLADAAPAARDNIAAHADVVAGAGDPSAELRALMPAIRQNADVATVRARWYFAEGNAQDYAQRLAVLNPSDTTANVRFILLRQPGPAVVREATLAPGGRADLVVNSLESFANSPASDVPAIIESNAPVIAERYMDFGSDISMSLGVRQPSRVWYFAEGATDGANRTFLVLFNPQASEVQATVTYMRDDGIAAEQSVRIGPLQRRVIVVGDRLANARFGMRVIASRPIVAERTMIFGAGSTLTTGGVHSAPGVTALSRRWYFAEGTTETPFQMAILVLNPNAQPVDTAVTFMTPDGTSLTRRYAIPATTRLAINVNEVVPQLGVATTVVADRPVVAERALYWNDGRAGTASAGAMEPAYTWRFADGRTTGEFQEFLLLNNPGKSQARVTLDYVLTDGTRVSDEPFTMPAGSRRTVAVHSLRPGQQALATTVRSTEPIVAERSVYRGDPRGSAGQGGATALGVPDDAP